MNTGNQSGTKIKCYIKKTKTKDEEWERERERERGRKKHNNDKQLMEIANNFFSGSF